MHLGVLDMNPWKCIHEVGIGLFSPVSMEISFLGYALVCVEHGIWSLVKLNMLAC